MTPRERAEKIMPLGSSPADTIREGDMIRAEAVAAIEAAVAQEREACAVIAEAARAKYAELTRHPKGDGRMADYSMPIIAAAIRARGPSKSSIDVLKSPARNSLKEDCEAVMAGVLAEMKAQGPLKYEDLQRPRADDVDHVADHFDAATDRHDGGNPPSDTRYDGDDPSSSNCPSCGRNLLLAAATTKKVEGLLHWSCPYCGAELIEDADQRIRAAPVIPDHLQGPLDLQPTAPQTGQMGSAYNPDHLK